MRSVTFLLNEEEFFEFFLAQKLGKTHKALMTGVEQPLDTQEFIQWIAYFRIEAAKRKEANKAR